VEGGRWVAIVLRRSVGLCDAVVPAAGLRQASAPGHSLALHGGAAALWAKLECKVTGPRPCHVRRQWCFLERLAVDGTPLHEGYRHSSIVASNRETGLNLAVLRLL
jgi:hypothetical protein